MTEMNHSLSFYTLFCGVILLDEQSNATLREKMSWLNRIDHPQGFLEHISRGYYPNFLSNISPEAINEQAIKHYTVPEFIASPRELSINLPSHNSLSVIIPYFDIYLFPDGVAIFAFKVHTHPEQATYQNLSIVLNHFRNPYSMLALDDENISVTDFIKKEISTLFTLREGWNKYIPQLKAYSIINDSSLSSFNDSLDHTLFEISHALPFGSSLDMAYSPSPEYYKEVMSNSISVFQNWKAIALFDTFTRISCSFEDTFKSWEHEYFLIYIHSLYTKFQLYSFNSKLKDVNVVDKQTTKIRNRFIEFVNDYHLAYISYKFLPNLLFDNMNRSLEIQKELDRMEVKIERIHETFQEKKSNQMNRLLLIISLLSILSVVADLSQWLIQMGIPEPWVYSPSVPFFLIGAITLLGFWLFKRGK
jgi:hypothetical protein